MITAEEIQTLIKSRLPDARVVARDMTGSADHWEIEVVWASFGGKPLIEQHKILHEILNHEMKDRIHAVKFKTRAA